MKSWSKVAVMAGVVLAGAAVSRGLVVPATAAPSPGAAFPTVPIGTSATVTCESGNAITGDLVGINSEWIVLRKFSSADQNEVWIPRKSVVLLGVHR